jgi:MoxR-like ATPase
MTQSERGAAPLMTPAEAARAKVLFDRVGDGLRAALFGQDDLIDAVLTALAARGHLLLEGLPGLGKTELVKTLSALLALQFRRVQFTPDLMPSDVTGGVVLEEVGGRRGFRFHPGPLFANLVLADEINRASPKTQAALLEAMQERRVTVLGETHELPDPFFVLATQNPIELEGTYPLPEAQLDRFLFKVQVPPVGEDVLVRILRERRRGQIPTPAAALSADELRELFALVDRVYLPEAVARYAARLVGASHPSGGKCPPAAARFLRYGASPRAAIALGEAGRAAALLAGRPNVDFSDIERVARFALGHRLVLDHTARLEGKTAADVVGMLLEAVDPTAAAASWEGRR